MFIQDSRVKEADLVFCYQNRSEKNNSCDGEKLLKFKAEGREFDFFYH